MTNRMCEEEKKFWTNFSDEPMPLYVFRELKRYDIRTYAFTKDLVTPWIDGVLHEDMLETLKEAHAIEYRDVTLYNNPAEAKQTRVYQLDDGTVVAVCEYLF